MEKPEVDCIAIESFSDFLALVRYIHDHTHFEHFALDLETDGKNERTANIHGIGIAFTDDTAYYFPIRDNKKQLLWSPHDLNEIYDWIVHLCSTYKLIGHNLVYDTLVFEYNSGFAIKQHVYSDTILQKHALDEERPFGLKDVAVKYLGAWADKAQERLYANIEANGGKTTSEQMDMWCADVDVLAEYCCWDVILTFRLFHLFQPMLKEQGLYKLFYDEETMPLYRECTIEMKHQGFNVDVAHFQQLREEIKIDIERFEDEIQTTLKDDIDGFVSNLLNEKHPVNRKGNFPKVAAEVYGIKLPVNKKTGAVTLSAKDLAKSKIDPHFLAWMNDTESFPFDEREVQSAMWRRANPDRRYMFNLSSNDHLRWLFFDHFGLEPIKETDSGEPSIDAETLEEMAELHPVCHTIVQYKKLCKLQGTYIEGILDRQINGILYTSLLQFGTTSGRYSSRDPNLQNLPRLKDDKAKLSPLVLKYTNAIKKGLIAPEGYKIVNADYSSLEPVCFAHASNDEKLRDVFRKGWDLYSAVAIEVWGLHQYSADKKSENYLGNHQKEMRQMAKVFCLAVVYGAEAGRISQALSIDFLRAGEIIQTYLDAYPGLKTYMAVCKNDAVTTGMVRNQFGRIRHLPRAKQLWDRYGGKLLNRRWAKENDLSETRYHLKNAINNACNFPIQSLAAHIVNRAMIETNRMFRARGLDARVVLQIHDEITCFARNDHAEAAREILKYCMEHTTEISVPLMAEPLIADNLADAK